MLCDREVTILKCTIIVSIHQYTHVLPYSVYRILTIIIPQQELVAQYALDYMYTIIIGTYCNILSYKCDMILQFPGNVPSNTVRVHMGISTSPYLDGKFLGMSRHVLSHAYMYVHVPPIPLYHNYFLWDHW